MVKSTRDYIKRKLEQSQTHCRYIFDHLSFIEDKYVGGNYEEYLQCVQAMMFQLADLNEMLRKFREVV